MKIKKIGHCCLVIEEKGLRILTDPGNYSTSQDQERNIDVILITHEHADHFHIGSLKELIKTNPKVKIITNKSVGALLDKENINYEIVEDKQSTKEKGVLIEGYGKEHIEIYRTWKNVQNTGYFIGNRLFYPGDAFYNPKKKVEILALPVAGPWCKISEAVDYALAVKPDICFPVHDGGLKIKGGNHLVPSKILPENDIKFIVIEEGKEAEL